MSLRILAVTLLSIPQLAEQLRQDWAVNNPHLYSAQQEGRYALSPEVKCRMSSECRLWLTTLELSPFHVQAVILPTCFLHRFRLELSGEVSCVRRSIQAVIYNTAWLASARKGWTMQRFVTLNF